ncbi:uncharacterized protein LOC141630211 [Silene latifolia]|uniref:uncharacterized protein LOC141630211 n=1 Tax=Silene latifolia TaxID=37657 RepID=UPI003D772D54
MTENIKNSVPFYLIGENYNCLCARAKVDASWSETLAASYGWIVYNPDGSCLNMSVLALRAESALQAEAVSNSNLLRWAVHSNILHFEASSDCLQILLQIAGVVTPHHLTKGIVNDIALLLPSFHCLKLSFIPRNLNKVAHNLARTAMSL